jgi:hypothetical protein
MSLLITGSVDYNVAFAGGLMALTMLMVASCTPAMVLGWKKSSHCGSPSARQPWTWSGGGDACFEPSIPYFVADRWDQDQAPRGRYAREDLDVWETQLSRSLTNGMFGENLTTSGVDVTGARIGERWRIGTDGLVLEVSAPRTPCRTFSAFLELDHWIRPSPRRRNPVRICGLSRLERCAPVTRSQLITAPITT